jgi:Na+/H+ antiporter NhaC
VGIVFHQGGTISTILAGTTVRPITDQHRISKEEVTYIVDSTASPVATVLPFNAWPLYVGGLVIGTTPLFETGTRPSPSSSAPSRSTSTESSRYS